MAERDEEQQAKPDSVGMDSLPSAQRNAIDFNNETAGRDTGRAKRFLPLAEETRATEKEREKEREFNALMRALQDPEYAKLYHEAQDTLARAREAADRAMRKLSIESADAADNLRKLRDAAAELPDGRKVFRSKDGRFLAEDGSDVTKDAGSVRSLSANAPSWEEYEAAKNAADDLAARTREVEEYRRDVLDPASRRLEDGDNPLSQDELKDLIAETKGSMPADVRTEFEKLPQHSAGAQKNPGSAAEEFVSPNDVNAPLLQLDFATARDAPAPSTSAPSPLSTPKAP